ncbi:hypothetical protein AB1Y20_003301 [Prymnesium parvum]|uniref:Uncharacterized protein n=1 Tax=Prymnesium parvum TaxID=97485 RepID=A0AB34JCM1_PRYPA
MGSKSRVQPIGLESSEPTEAGGTTLPSAAPKKKRRRGDVQALSREAPPLVALHVRNFGSIRFPGSRMSPAKWARVPVTREGVCVRAEQQKDVRELPHDRAYAEVLMSLLTTTWGVAPPSALLSVLGPSSTAPRDPANILVQKPELQLIVQRMLCNIATKIGAWVFTSGLCDADTSNVVSMVARAMEGSDVPCVGFAPWGQLSEQHALKAQEGNVHFLSSDQHSAIGGGAATLASCHSHYVLVDDGTADSDAARRVRTQLRMFISTSDVSGDGIETPVISLVFNGDEGTLQMILIALRDDMSPVAIFAGTGGAAWDVYNYYHHGRLPSSAERSEAYVRVASELLPEIVTCGKYTGHNGTELLTFFNLDESSKSLSGIEQDVGQKLLLAVLNGCRTTKEEILLAVAWGNKEIVQSLLQREPEWPDDPTLIEAASEKYLLSGGDREGVQLRQAIAMYVQVHSALGAASIDLQKMHSVMEAFLVSRTRETRQQLLEAFAPSADKGSSASPSRVLVRQMKGWALEAALLHKNISVVQTLLDFAAEASRVSGHELWKSSAAMVRYNRETMLVDREWAAGDWSKVLEKLIDGYAYHMQVRRALEPHTVKPTWTDLTLWCVLVGERELAHTLWQRSRMPLRTALMASQFCLLMASDDKMASDATELAENSAYFEQWALDLLDEMEEDDAHNSLLIIRSSAKEGSNGSRPLLWAASALDSASTDDGVTSVPCKRVVGHKHAGSIVEDVFVGDYPNSYAMISQNASWVAILLQCVFFFLPNFFCNVEPPTWPTRVSKARRKEGEASESSSRRGEQLGEDEEPENWAICEQQRRERNKLKGMVDDVVDDYTSFRFLSFFGVPKVKFLCHVLVFLLYTYLPVHFLISYEVEAGGITSYEHPFSLPRHISGWEIVFWVWSFGYFIGELEQVEVLMPPRPLLESSLSLSAATSRIAEGFRLHFRVMWNTISLIASLLVLVAALVRVFAKDDKDAQVAVRCTYAVVVVLCGFKMLELVRIWKSVGILSIITIRMIVDDCGSFAILLLVLAAPFGLALSILQPRSLVGEDFLVGGFADRDFDQLGGVSDPMYLTIFRYFSSPFWAPWIALVGEFDVGALIDSSKGVTIVEWLLPMLYYIYLILALVVLLNLLIAAMSSTFESLAEVATEEWKYARVQLVLQYKDRKSWPAPFNLVHVLVRLLFFCAHGCRSKTELADIGFKLVNLSVSDELAVQGQEQAALKLCHSRQVQSRAEASAVVRLQEEMSSFKNISQTQMEVLHASLLNLTSRVETIQTSLEARSV